MNEHVQKTHGRWWKTRLVLGILVIVIVIIALIGAITPWPSAMVIRAVFTQGGDSTAAEMNKHLPSTPVTEMLDIAYADDGADTTMDVFSPASATGPLPTIVWIHGGAWISGSKENVDPYMRILASQMAGIITNPDYAEILSVTPALKSEQLVATVLNCGVYDLAALAALDGVVGWGLKTAMWAYTGERTWAEGSAGATMSTLNWVSEDFPATYISGGNGDGLTWLQSIPMAQRLDELGVDVTTLFWPADHEPALPHEYQFHLDMPDAQTALQQTIDFLDTHTK